MSENQEKERSIKDNSDSESDNLEINSDDSEFIKEDKKHLEKILSTMDEAELQRYETFRRSNFSKSLIKKFISSVIGQAVNPNLVIAVSGIAKVFVGEMIEVAKQVQREYGEEGPLLPSHIHEAHRRIYDKIPNMKVFKSPPWD